MGLGDLVEVACRTTATWTTGRTTAISSIGMFEHVGLERLHE